MPKDNKTTTVYFSSLSQARCRISSPARGRRTRESRLTPEQHARIQQSLAAGGFLDDKPDGEFGPNTRSAIKRFKSQSGSPESEFLTANERERLLQEELTISRIKPASPSPRRSILVPLQKEGGTYVVPVLENDAIPLRFVVDSGAADVSIPADVVSTLFGPARLIDQISLAPRRIDLPMARACPL